MEGKERIIELKIEDDDLISGVDQISLVDEGAIEYDWIAFKKQEQKFVIPDGEDEKFLSMFDNLGESNDDLNEKGWVLDRVIDMNKDEFAIPTSDPNIPLGKSEDDTTEQRIRYKYGLRSQIKQNPIIPTSRAFCRQMIAKNRVYTREDIQGIRNEFGLLITEYAGGWNCRHRWFKLIYKPEGRIINKSSVNKNKIGQSSDTDFPQTFPVNQKTTNNPSPSSIRNLGLSKHNYTLPLFEREADAIDYSKLIGCEEGAHSHMVGGVTMWMPCASHPEDMDIDVSGLPPYVDEIPECDDCKKKRKKEDIYEEFETYNDYPKAASENAKIALRWADEHGWGSCGTPVGKKRANQLANGENISKDTISRMAAFERHRQHSDRELGDGCGRLMWLAWGGDEGIEWAQRKLDQIKEDMDLEEACWPGYEPIGTKRKDGRTVPNCVPVENSKTIFSFQDDDEQMTVVGPAMIPNKKIVRSDYFGNKYYVYFSEETIKQISDKFMKRGYTRDTQHDIMHSGPGEKDVYVAESWIIEDPENDKSRMYGFDDLPKGTWMTKMKINNKDIWEKVKSGELRGFSVSGFFEEYERNANELQFLRELAEILKK